MKKPLAFLLLSSLSLIIFGQELSSDFRTIQINKKIKEFPDTLDLGSPLKSCVTINYIMINGKDRLWSEVSTIKFKNSFPDPTTPDSKVNEELKSLFLETTIKEIIYYKDSIACTISEINGSNYLIRFFYLENSKWVNAGEDEIKDLENARQSFKNYADNKLHDLRRVVALSNVPTDTSSFINYLKNRGCDPKEFVLNKLNKYKLVMYGEIHQRKASWDFLQEIVKDKRFAKNIGVIFMEMASHKQNDINRFLANDTIDKELLLNVFREYMVGGWIDKGMFDFVECVWQTNKKMPKGKKIKIIAADTPRPFSTFQSKEDMRNSDAKYDRDEFMASTIINYLESKKDKRNALFIVGSGHTCKTTQSAGSILSKKMSHNLYSIFQHSPRVEEGATIYERIRHGIFDYAFYKLENKSVAFELKNSPFGKEPFDGLNYDGTGTYEENYDGYLFFGSLDNEPNGELLMDLFNDQFINEMDRRLHLEGSSLMIDWGLKELSKKAVIDHIKAKQSQTRWGNYLKPLQAGITIQ